MIDANAWVTPRLEKIFSAFDSEDPVVKAASYSLFAGGKRMRPALMYAGTVALKDYGVCTDDVLSYASCLEMIHTYSLIHDDLPCMDDDDLRRGRPTCHKVYGEGIAVLAGDMLLNTAHEELIRLAMLSGKAAKASYNISHLAGIAGMIGGQSIDLESEGKKISLERLHELQNKKTGALIEAAVTTPYYLSDAGEDVLAAMKDYALHLGLAFQIKDDILDVEADEEKLGKSTGKDERDDKSTFVTLLGLEGAKAKLEEEENACYEALDYLSSKNMDIILLKELTDFNLKRDY